VAYPHICLISFFPIEFFVEVNQGMDYSYTLQVHDRVILDKLLFLCFPELKNMLISRWTDQKGLFDLMKTQLMVEAMKAMVKALVTAIVRSV
jgi:hypothetical protein